MKTTLGETTALDWAKLGTDFAANMTNILVNKGNNNSGTTTPATIPTTTYNQPTGYAQPAQKDNTLLYVGGGLLAAALLYALMSNNKKR